jgi:hypothetical protein
LSSEHDNYTNTNMQLHALEQCRQEVTLALSEEASLLTSVSAESTTVTVREEIRFVDEEASRARRVTLFFDILCL